MQPRRLASTAAMLADPSRAAMVLALMDGRSRSAKKLALDAGVTAQTASSHLRKLVASRIDKNQPRLINLADDIAEAHDLTDKQPDKVKALRAAWQAWSAEQHEPLWPPQQAAAKKNNKK